MKHCLVWSRALAFMFSQEMVLEGRLQHLEWLVDILEITSGLINGLWRLLCLMEQDTIVHSYAIAIVSKFWWGHAIFKFAAVHLEQYNAVTAPVSLGTPSNGLCSLFPQQILVACDFYYRILVLNCPVVIRGFHVTVVVFRQTALQLHVVVSSQY